MKGYIIHLFIYHSPLLVALFSLSGYRYLGDGGTDRREILHDGRPIHIGPGQVFSPFGSGGPTGTTNPKLWA